MAHHDKSAPIGARSFPFLVPPAESLADIEAGVAVGFTEGGSIRILPIDLGGMSAVSAEVLAAALEEMARHLRDGWRGNRGTMH